MMIDGIAASSSTVVPSGRLSATDISVRKSAMPKLTERHDERYAG